MESSATGWLFLIDSLYIYIYNVLFTCSFIFHACYILDNDVLFISRIDLRMIFTGDECVRYQATSLATCRISRVSARRLPRSNRSTRRSTASRTMQASWQRRTEQRRLLGCNPSYYIYIYMFVTYHDILLRIINIHLNTFYDMLQHITVLYIIISHFNILWRIIALYIYNNVKHNINVIRHTTTLLISKATTLYT